MFLSLHRKKLNPKFFPSIIEMQNHKKIVFYVRVARESKNIREQGEQCVS